MLNPMEVMYFVKNVLGEEHPEALKKLCEGMRQRVITDEVRKATNHIAGVSLKLDDLIEAPQRPRTNADVEDLEKQLRPQVERAVHLVFDFMNRPRTRTKGNDQPIT